MHTFVVCSELEKKQQNVIHETALVCERFKQDSEMNSSLRIFSRENFLLTLVESLHETFSGCQ